MVKPEERSLAAEKIKHLLSTRDKVVNTIPVRRLNDALNQLQGIQQFKNIHEIGQEFDKTPLAFEAHKGIAQTVNVLKDNLDARENGVFVSLNTPMAVLKVLNDNKGTIEKVKDSDHAKNALKELRDALKTDEAVRVARELENYKESQPR